jgi:hypothetical protein
MSPTQVIEYEAVNASPVKSFFVSMLTRDITLEEAILDLLDNCVDGILRIGPKASEHPYRDYHAEIEFDKDSFTISDNCGGIPWALHEYAFRMGRAKASPGISRGSVGVYGIGMKRAIFKLGKHALISTQNKNHRYEVEIKPKWLNDQDDWTIPVEPMQQSMDHDGTTIVVGELYKNISERFSTDSDAFENDLKRMVATHYAFIIDKGFSVKINRARVQPKPTRLIFTETSSHGRRVIQPYIFKTKTKDGVSVFLAVGFTRPIPSELEAVSSEQDSNYSSLDAGWTIVCNDRAVLYCDRTELTGWGEAGVPRYHNQFIAISGIVEFTSADPSKLPTTTTKRGIDASSPLYLRVKNKMREGMLLFTDYTNKWKGRADESRKQIGNGIAMPFDQLKDKSSKLRFRKIKSSVLAGEQYRPLLPMPAAVESSKRRISFTKSAGEVRLLGEHLFEDPDYDPSAIGEKCFDIVLREARK